MEKVTEAPQGVTISKLAAMLRKLDIFKKSVDEVKTATVFVKAQKAENALENASALFSDQALMIHEYNAIIERLDRRLSDFETVQIEHVLARVNKLESTVY